ncbi:MAG: hypothetical protein ABEJ22_04920 [Haloferacaceae archaeon]
MSNAESHSAYYDRLREHASRADEARESFDPPADPPADEEGMDYLRNGLGPLVVLYVEARTASRDVEFSAEEHRLFHRALNDWLALWTACHGVETDPDFTIRKAAELLIETHNVRDVAQLLTHVPER